MNRPNFTQRKLPLLVALALLTLSSARAQDAKPAAPTDNAKDATLQLDTVVVTGASQRTTKLASTISVSTLEGDQIASKQAQNASDILSTIPGIFVQSSGGGGNANVSVRGVPVSGGGSRYVQFQEDGLPVLLFGDIAFGNPDDFIRIDTSIDRVEVVRGGTGATLTTNGPGGIINLISKTGKEAGGSIGLTTGLGHRSQRLDFSYGGQLTNKTRFYIGGYTESGTGPRKDNIVNMQGGQIKGNLTHEFDNGYVRLNFKHLSDTQPMYMPAPVTYNNGRITTVPGIDPRHYTGYSPDMPTDVVLTNSNTLSPVSVNKGMQTESTSFGIEASFKLGNGWVLDEKLRSASNSGRWVGFFPANAVAAAPADATYANGTKAGTPYAGLVLNNVIFNVDVKDLGATTNDLRVTKTADNVGGGRLTYGAGLFTNTQDVNLVWNFNGYLTTATAKPAPINSVTAGATSNGFLGPQWGACCERDYAATYTTTAPYAFANFQTGPLTVDASLRRDSQRASGYYNLATRPIGSPDITIPSYSPANAVPIDYTVSHTEYSLGANYVLNKDLAVFARYSRGAAFNADRIMANGPLSGNVAIPINTLDQFEGGVKARFGGLSAFLTVFEAKTSEFNYTGNFQVLTTNKYRGRGIELETSYRFGAAYINGGLTYTDSKTVASNIPALVGTPANRQPKLIYSIGGGYSTGLVDLGVNVHGVSSATETGNAAPDNKLPAYSIVTAHVDYNLTPATTVSLGVYNLFNTLGYTELGGASARALNGRTAKLSLKYTF